jgi:precorrin-4 methylase
MEFLELWPHWLGGFAVSFFVNYLLINTRYSIVNKKTLKKMQDDLERFETSSEDVEVAMRILDDFKKHGMAFLRLEPTSVQIWKNKL